MQQGYPEPTDTIILGFEVMVDDVLGHIAVRHDGGITWDQLQAIKNNVWGADVEAIEVYPAQSRVINNAPLRHLWRLGSDDFCPDLLGRSDPPKTLEARFHRVWRTASDDQVGALCQSSLFLPRP